MSNESKKAVFTRNFGDYIRRIIQANKFDSDRFELNIRFELKDGELNLKQMFLTGGWTVADRLIDQCQRYYFQRMTEDDGFKPEEPV